MAKLDCARFLHILHDMQEACADIQRNIEINASQFTKIQEKLDKLNITYESISDLNHAVDTRELEGLLDRMSMQARKTADKMYRYSSDLCAPELFGSAEAARVHLYNSVDMAVDGISVIIEPDVIYIRTPLLFSRSRSRDPFLSHSIQAYADGVGRAIELNAAYLGLEREKYMRKTLFFLHVLNQKSPHVDNDNYDTTAVTNSIVGHLYGGDSPLTCRMVYDSVRSDELAEGTYITVLPGRSKIPENDAVVHYWCNQAK